METVTVKYKDKVVEYTVKKNSHNNIIYKNNDFFPLKKCQNSKEAKKTDPNTRDDKDHLAHVSKDPRYIIAKVRSMSDKILKCPDTNKRFETLFNDIQNAKKKDDLKNIINNFIELYFKSMQNPESIKRYSLLLEINEDLAISGTIIELTQRYLFETLNSLPNSKINELEYLKLKEPPMEELYKTINIKINDDIKSKGIKLLIEKSFLSIIDVIYNYRLDHLCFDCQNGHPDTCEKIRDTIDIKDLKTYDFVEFGHEVRKNGEIDVLIISKCQNYKEEPNSPPKTLKKLRASYGDAERTYFSAIK